MKTLNQYFRKALTTLTIVALFLPVAGHTTSIPVSEYSGQVTTNGDFNPLKDLQPLPAGPYNRSYNGVEVDDESAAPMNEETYLAKSLEMTSFMWGITEVGQKLCKPVSGKWVQSLVDWWFFTKNYVAAEKSRDALMRDRIEKLNLYMDEIRSGDKNELQLKAIEFQVQSLNMSIDSIAGSTLFALDNQAAVARATARLPWRENLLAAAYKASEKNELEDVKNGEVYKSCLAGIEGSKSAATAGCARTKKVQECTPGATADAPAVCVEVTKPDPVPGSCAMVSSMLPALQGGPLKNLVETYLSVPAPSKTVNGKIINIGEVITATVGGFPVSNDPKYDWTTPLGKCLKPMIDTVKDHGIICPSDAPATSFDKVAVDKIISTANMKIDGSNVSSCITTITSNKSVAQQACERTKTLNLYKNWFHCSTGTDKYETCPNEYKAWSNWVSSITNTGNCAGGECMDGSEIQSTTVTIADPVPGSCEMAKENFPSMLNGALSEMTALLALPPQQSVADRLNQLGATVNFHTSKLHAATDPQFNWQQNLESCLKNPMIVASTIESTQKESIAVEQKAIEPFNLPPADNVTESAKSFLTAMGIYEPALKEATEKFKANFNTTDLYLGQPNARKLYFKYVIKLIEEVISADRAKLSKLVSDRQKLLDLHARLKRLLDQGTGSGAAAVNLAQVDPSKSSAGNTPGSTNTKINGPATGTLAEAASGSGAVNFGTTTSSSGAHSSVLLKSGSGSNSSSTLSTGGSASNSAGRNFAISKSSRDQIELSKRNLNSLQKKARSLSSQISKTTGKGFDSDAISAKISKNMSETLSNQFAKKHAKILDDAMSGGVAPMQESVEFADNSYGASFGSTKGSSFGASSDYGASFSGSSNLGGSVASTRTSSKSNSNDHSPANGIRSGSYNQAGNGNSNQASANSKRSGQYLTKSDNGSASATRPYGEYRKVEKPDLFKRITDRYNNSGRSRLGLETVEGDDQ